MREYKDRAWDEKFQNYKIQKERRKQMEAIKSASTTSNVQQPFVNNRIKIIPRRNDLKMRNEESSYVSKGPSRFLRSHMTNTQQSNIIQSHQNPAHIINIVEEKPLPQSTHAVKVESRDMSNMSLMEMLPYILIIFGIIVVILVLTKVI